MGALPGAGAFAEKAEEGVQLRMELANLKVNSNKHSQFFVFNNTLSSLRTKKIMVLI